MKYPLVLSFLAGILFISSMQANPSAEEEVNQVQTDFNEMDQKMSDLRKRFGQLELRMSKMIASPQTQENVEQKETIEKQSTSDVVIEKNPVDTKSIGNPSNATASPIEPEENNESKKKSSLRAFYAVTFPMATDFRNHEVEYEWGHHTEVRLTHHWNKFFLGGSMGGKVFRTDKFITPYSPGHLFLPAKGVNYSIFSNISLGFEHYLSEKTYLTSSLGLGAGWAWDKIKIDNTQIWKENDPFLYGMFQLGVGYRMFDSLSALVFYQLDGYGKRSHFDTQLFNQVGASLSIHF